VDCHLPQAFIPKYIAKADEGWRHSKAFTLQNFHEPIQITPHDSKILQNNCVRCHGELLHSVLAGSTTDEDAVKCVHCHQGAGHGVRY
jgi:cytochrome c nitrite reductase small subunit